MENHSQEIVYGICIKLLFYFFMKTKCKFLVEEIKI